MCVVSSVGDFWGDRWRPTNPTVTVTGTTFPYVTRAELEALREELMEAIAGLRAAIEVDRENGDKLCGEADKFEVLRRVADALGLGEELREVLEDAGVGT
jgi:hypothetical protein